jgi:hypothetical protein
VGLEAVGLGQPENWPQVGGQVLDCPWTVGMNASSASEGVLYQKNANGV